MLICVSGLTDSSDDEENKYFEEAKYSKCGKDLREIMKQKSAADKKRFVELSSRDVGLAIQKSRESLTNISENKIGEKDNESEKVKDFPKSPFVDPVLNMRIINPLYSSAALQRKMINRVSIGSNSIKNFLQTPNSKTLDWVTGGVIVSKISKTSEKGNMYCVWNITDLTGEIKTVCIFLFGSAYREFWKTSVGTVVGILNPDVMENRDKSEATLRVDNVSKILVIGTSRDYGICKSRKKNGEKCTGVVNTAKSEFCTFHVLKEYNKICRKSGVPSSKTSRSISNLQKKVLGKNQVFAGGRIYTGVVGKKSSEKVARDLQRLKSLSGATLTACQKNKQENVSKDSPNEKSEAFMSFPKSPPNAQGGLINLNKTVTPKERNIAKALALTYVRKHGPIKKVEENKKVGKTPEQIALIKRKLESNENKCDKLKEDADDSLLSESKKRYLEQQSLLQNYMARVKGHSGDEKLLKVAESDQREKYFGRLEIREKMENKMASTFSVQGKGVLCLTCNYKSFTPSDYCKKNKHPLKAITTTKKFWKCRQCSNRMTSLDKIPLDGCKTCGSYKWERSSMLPDKGPNLIVEPLSLRGHEEKYIGAVTKNPNLNLLVPEEGSQVS